MKEAVFLQENIFLTSWATMSLPLPTPPYQGVARGECSPLQAHQQGSLPLPPLVAGGRLSRGSQDGKKNNFRNSFQSCHPPWQCRLWGLSWLLGSVGDNRTHSTRIQSLVFPLVGWGVGIIKYSYYSHIKQKFWKQICKSGVNQCDKAGHLTVTAQQIVHR